MKHRKAGAIGAWVFDLRQAANLTRCNLPLLRRHYRLIEIEPHNSHRQNLDRPRHPVLNRRKKSPMRHPNRVRGFSLQLKIPVFIETIDWIRIALWILAGFNYQPSRLALADEPPVQAIAVKPSIGTRNGFSLLTSTTTGLAFTNTLTGDAYLTNAVAHNGSGVAIGDIDGDGWPDLYFCSLSGRNQLFRNLGQWKFAPLDIGVAACNGQRSTGAVFADLDGDGDLDLLVNGIAAGTRLFLNDGAGHWTEKLDSGLASGTSSTSMALADMDGDGDLDLYCTHYIDFMHLIDPTTHFEMGQSNGRWIVSKVNGISTSLPRFKDRFEVLADGEIREIPEADALYRNDGNGHLTAIQSDPGVFLDESGRPMLPPRDWGLAVVFRDLDGDGFPDLYISNDYASPDRLLINDGRGHFRAISPLKLRHTSFNSMGIDVADVDRDGLDDILVLDLLAARHERRLRQLSKKVPDPRERESLAGRPQFNRNMLFFGRPRGGFGEGALQAGVAASDWSWCPVFLDIDLDGYEDLLITSGFEFDLMDQDTHDRLKDPRPRLNREQLKRSMQNYPQWRTKVHAFHNRGDGTFASASNWGFQEESLAFGMALGDFDQDGDLDVVVNTLNSPARLYRNEATAGRIGVRLRGRAPNTAGIGARLRLLGPTITQGQEMVAGGRYLSGDQTLRTFATDLARTNALGLEVRWRNGTVSWITNVEPNRVYEINESTARPPLNPASDIPTPSLFVDISSVLNHDLVGESFDDSVRQPLLPRRLSRLGPGVAWFDVDGDGWEDLIIGAPRGGQATLFSNQEGKKFQPNRGNIVSGGQRGVVGWVDGQGKRKWLAATSNLSFNDETPSQLNFYSGADPTPRQQTEIGNESVGPLAIGDIDGDGDLDLFVGGQFQQGRYPEPVRSTVWQNDVGTLNLSSKASQALVAAGFVNGATLVDLDGDGDLDLALAVEWGPIRIFLNQFGIFKEATKELGLAERTGWWTGIVAGDFDGDGRMDLAVGNAGRNTGYALFRPNPIRLYYGEWTLPGRIEILEAWQGEGTWLPIKNRTLLAVSLPNLATRFPTHEQFGHASIPEILGPHFMQSRFLEATELDSGILLNRGSRFEWRTLPRQAQISPVFSVHVADVDGDGTEDLFLSQNRSDLMPELSRDDAGRGLWLKGLGEGRFEALDANVTGISANGEQRGAALADFNHDGRIDLVVAQDNGPTRFYLNRQGRPGLRVVLHGPAANPDGIGAQVRLHFQNGRAGPIRAIQGGSGFSAHDSPTAVLGTPTIPIAVWIRWPGGREQVVPISADQLEIREVRIQYQRP